MENQSQNHNRMIVEISNSPLSGSRIRDRTLMMGLCSPNVLATNRRLKLQACSAPVIGPVVCYIERTELAFRDHQDRDISSRAKHWRGTSCENVLEHDTRTSKYRNLSVHHQQS